MKRLSAQYWESWVTNNINADIGHKPPQFSIINGAIAKVRSKNKKERLYLKEGSGSYENRER